MGGLPSITKLLADPSIQLIEFLVTLPLSQQTIATLPSILVKKLYIVGILRAYKLIIFVGGRKSNDLLLRTINELSLIVSKLGLSALVCVLYRQFLMRVAFKLVFFGLI